jgi:hypothetical protein
MNDDPELKVAKLKAKYKGHTDKAQSSRPIGSTPYTTSSTAKMS